MACLGDCSTTRRVEVGFLSRTPTSSQRSTKSLARDGAVDRRRVDCAADWSACADEVTLLTASETDAELGTFLTAGSKLSHAESSDPIGAFCTA